MRKLTIAFFATCVAGFTADAHGDFPTWTDGQVVTHTNMLAYNDSIKAAIADSLAANSYGWQTEAEVLALFPDTTAALRTEWRSDISDSLDTIDTSTLMPLADVRDSANAAIAASATIQNLVTITSPGQLKLTLDGDDLAPGQYSGLVDSLTAGENLVAGDLVYRHSNGKWLKAQADSVESANAEMVALESISANYVGLGLRYGYIKLSRWSETITGNYLAAPMYVSAGSAGYVTASIPASAGNVIVPIGSGGGRQGLLFFNPPAKGQYVVRGE